MNIETFCTSSGVSFSDKVALRKMYGNLITKPYSEWYDIVSIDFQVPRNLSSSFVRLLSSKEEIVQDSEVEEEKDDVESTETAPATKSSKILKTIKDSNKQ